MNAQAGMLAYLFGRSRGLGAVWRMPRCAAALGRFCLLAMHSSAHEMKTVAGTLGRSGRVCPAGGREGPSGLRCPAEAGGRCPQETAKSPFLSLQTAGMAHGARSDAVLWRLCRRGFPGFFSWQPDAVPRESSSGEQPEWLAASKEASLEENARPGPAADFGVLACMW